MTAEQQRLLREIPQVDELLRGETLMAAAAQYGPEAVAGAARAETGALRRSILLGRVTSPAPARALCEAVLERLAHENAPRLRRVVNATGVALHTNLGRAPLAAGAARAAAEAASGYSNLEYDLETGGRGSRNGLVEPLLCALCGCEAALAVNNNAAALLLALTALARGKDIPVSRGELVEIGDGFRVPEVMAQSGGRLVEVGSTNRTHPRDYEAVLENGNTGVLLKIHTSNFRMIGFTEAVSVRELSGLGRKYGVPVVADLGSGALLEAGEYPFSDEPTVPQTLRDGADVVCFSGDKLLGGPQAGILLGKRALIDAMRAHPLARALRIDKLSLAALEATLRLYGSPARAKARIPVLRMLCASPEALRERAEALCALLREAGVPAETIPCRRPVGGGAAPARELDGYAAAVSPACGAAVLAARLHAAEPPVVARISGGRVLFDVSTMEDADFPEAARAVGEACGE